MAAIREAVSHVLHANNPAPAILLGSEWQVLAANASTARALWLGRDRRRTPPMA